MLQSTTFAQQVSLPQRHARMLVVSSLDALMDGVLHTLKRSRVWSSAAGLCRNCRDFLAQGKSKEIWIFGYGR